MSYPEPKYPAPTAIHMSFIAGTPGAPPIPGADGRAARDPRVRNQPNRQPVKEA
jgi:hypothetical protein